MFNLFFENSRNLNMSFMKLAASRLTRVYVNHVHTSNRRYILEVSGTRGDCIVSASQNRNTLHFYGCSCQSPGCCRCLSDTSVLCAAATQVHFANETLNFLKSSSLFIFLFFFLFSLYLFLIYYTYVSVYSPALIIT
jgi:hypothetical protein